MNRTTLLPAVAIAVVCSGCVVRTAPVVTAPPPRVVVTPPPPVVVTPPPVVVAPRPAVVVAPPVLAAPPSVVLVPGTTVYTAPGMTFNVFVYGGRYYSYYQGSWFVAQRAGTPWSAVAIDHVPTPVRAVPPHYYRVPPGRAQDPDRHHDRGHDHGKGHDHGRGPDRDDHRGDDPRHTSRGPEPERGQPQDRASAKAQADERAEGPGTRAERDDKGPAPCPPGQARKGAC